MIFEGCIFCPVPSEKAQEPARDRGNQAPEALVFTEAPPESQYIDWNALVSIMQPWVSLSLSLSETINHPLGPWSLFPVP